MGDINYIMLIPTSGKHLRVFNMSKVIKLVILLALLIGIGFFAKADADMHGNASLSSNSSSTLPVSINTLTSNSSGPSSQPSTNPCATNTLSQLILVSISQRHLWACDLTTVEYSSPVVTGMEFLAADLTPPGTYHILDKETDVRLSGGDSTGNWNDYVYYWMPFLDNQYGAYGFHDATWRPGDAFGDINDNSDDASHGCIECPLATAAWLYSWAKVGTTVTIQS